MRGRQSRSDEIGRDGKEGPNKYLVQQLLDLPVAKPLRLVSICSWGRKKDELTWWSVSSLADSRSTPSTCRPKVAKWAGSADGGSGRGESLSFCGSGATIAGAGEKGRGVGVES